MAAYGALVSLMNTMDQIQIRPHLSTSFNKSRLESLGDTVNFLLDFIESYNCGGSSKEVEDLEGGIASAAHAVEDAIESHIVDLIEEMDNEKNGGMLQKMRRWITKKPVDLPSVICDLQKVTEDVRKVGKQGRSKYQTPNSAASSRPVSAGKTRMVGFEDYLHEIPSRIGEIPTLQIIRLFQCSVPCALSAVKILEEQEANGNEDLQVEVGFFAFKGEAIKRFKEKMEQKGFTSKNLHIK